jgi:hypothetical protein
MSSEISHMVAYDNYNDFQQLSTSNSHNISFHYFEDCSMTKLTLG